MIKRAQQKTYTAKKRNSTSFYFAITTTFLSAAFFVSILWNSYGNIFAGAELPRSSLTYTSATPVSAATSTRVLDFENPIRLAIPSISVDAKVEEVGVARNGTMAIPSTFHTVGWYKYGTVPGEMGSAVMGGHYDNGLSLDGVFKNLKNMKPGDDIFVYDRDNTEIHFKVVSMDMYGYKEVPVDAIFNDNDRPLLRLITCDGQWIKKEKTYDARLVVTAILAEDY